MPLPAAACDELRVWLAAQKEYRRAQGPAWNEAGRVVLRLTTAARAKAVAGLDEVTRAALEQAETKAAGDALPAPDNAVALAGRRR